jgi:vacuolar-type H+-ATPase subunit I/STV1
MGGGFLGWILAAVGGYVVKSAIKPYVSKLNLGSGSSETIKTVVKILASLAIFAVTTIVLYATLFGPERDALPVVWVTLAAALFVGLAVTGKPVELAANRMLIFSTVVGGWTIALSAAAMRTNLLEAQVELDGVVGQYKDTQITSGYFLALLGMLTAFVGATSLWAKRRDIIINQQRAERQRAAAIASAAEIQAALELAQQHQRDSRTKQSS